MEFSRVQAASVKERHRKTEKGACCSVWHWPVVGTFAAEALARGGVGHLALWMGCGKPDNSNRQLIATQKSIGRRKTLSWQSEF